ncbi:MAG: transposase [Verrucomicrobiota bacterium]
MRSARIKVEDTTAVYHCMSRCVGGMWLLKETEKEVLRKQIYQVAAFCGVEVITYTIMSNHFHVLVRVPLDQLDKEISDAELVRRFALLYPRQPKKAECLESLLKQGGIFADQEREKALKRMGDVSFFMKELKQRFTIWYNRSRAAKENGGKRRYGTVWAERFKSLLVENSEAALQAVAAYIDLNSVRAKVVVDPKDYRWSGYGQAVGGCKQAQVGLKAIYNRVRWDATQREYRKLLYLEATHVTKAQVKAKAGEQKAIASYDTKQVRKVIDQGGKLSLQEVLRCRVRYMSDGAVLGSKDFVNEWFIKKKEQVAQLAKDYQLDTSNTSTYEKRSSGARKMSGAHWGELTVFSDLKREVFG